MPHVCVCAYTGEMCVLDMVETSWCSSMAGLGYPPMLNFIPLRSHVKLDGPGFDVTRQERSRESISEHALPPRPHQES